MKTRAAHIKAKAEPGRRPARGPRETRL